MRLNTGSGGGIDSDMLDGVHAADLEESAEITSAITNHDADAGAHASTIASAVSSGIGTHNIDGTAHADIRTSARWDAPLGTVVSVYIGMAGVPPTAEYQAHGWALCNGTTPSSQGITSPLITAATPNINGNGWFIRGGATAGTSQSDNVGSHSHSATFSSGNAASAGDHAHTYSGTTSTVGNHQHPQNVSANTGLCPGGGYRWDFDADTSGLCTYPQGIYTDPAGTHNHTFSGTTSTTGAHEHSVSGTVSVTTNTPGGETRPVNISMVFFMKVK
ncbi:MAG TPA: hypothetical protein PLI09_25835, partial [Candidatus Hydrogenedentes bacterium]|nr:hypothetical protein [Candidatus Hydrogenedentota bacterium]